jgi:Domain of unknown function (DUF389)
VHTEIEVIVPSSRTDELIEDLQQLDDVISLSVVREASIKPPGDVFTVHALNRGADEVLRLADAARKHGQVSVSTAELTSLIDPEHERKVANDVDEALWEEVETDLRHQGKLTTNYIGLMALGGAVAATGFAAESSSQAISFVAASIIAPGFEPLAAIPIGLALRRWAVVGRGLQSAVGGYLALILSAALTFLALRATGVVMVEEFTINTEVRNLAEPGLREIIVSGCGALAGMVMLLSRRHYLIPGALVALLVIEAAALIGVALAAGEPGLMFEGAKRFGLDILLIVVGGIPIVVLKQAFVHRRAPMI